MHIHHNGNLIYQSQKRQTAFHINQAQCRLYGGAAGGGKTEAMLWEIFAICTDMNWKNLRGAVFRKTIPDIEKYFIQRAQDVFPSGSYTYNQKKRVMKFKGTGSQVEFNFCESESDLTSYQGAQWDFLGIDEFTQHSEYVFKYLFARLRTKKKDWQVRFFGGSNPGGIGHAWVKRIWIDKDLTEVEKKFTWDFIPARLEDNPAMLKDNPNYEDQLMMLPDETLRKAWRYGDWNVFAGQFFTEIRQDVHAYEPFEISRHWARFISIDYGYDHLAAVYWYAVDEDGEVYIYKEFVCRNKTYRQLAQRIIELTDENEEVIDYLVADPSIWAKKGGGDGMSGAEEMQEEFEDADRKWVLTQANNDRINGWGIMREWLKIDQREGKPHTRLHISKDLTMWWKYVPMLQRDPKKPEDVMKATIQKDDGTISYSDDPGDSTRYGLMSRPSPRKIKKEPEKRDRYGQIPKKKTGISITGRPEWKPAGGTPKWKGNTHNNEE